MKKAAKKKKNQQRQQHKQHQAQQHRQAAPAVSVASAASNPATVAARFDELCQRHRKPKARMAQAMGLTARDVSAANLEKHAALIEEWMAKEPKPLRHVAHIADRRNQKRRNELIKQATYYTKRFYLATKRLPYMDELYENALVQLDDLYAYLEDEVPNARYDTFSSWEQFMKEETRLLRLIDNNCPEAYQMLLNQQKQYQMGLASVRRLLNSYQREVGPLPEVEEMLAQHKEDMEALHKELEVYRSKRKVLKKKGALPALVVAQDAQAASVREHFAEEVWAAEQAQRQAAEERQRQEMEEQAVLHMLRQLRQEGATNQAARASLLQNVETLLEAAQAEFTIHN